jgi:hypothetical protein
MVPVPYKFSSGPTLLVALGSVYLVPSILIPSDQSEWMVPKNANHYKTCIIVYICLSMFFSDWKIVEEKFVAP